MKQNNITMSSAEDGAKGSYGERDYVNQYAVTKPDDEHSTFTKKNLAVKKYHSTNNIDE